MRVFSINNVLRLSVLLTTAFLFFCVDHNPFTNPLNAKVVITLHSFGNSTAHKIFSRDSLIIRATVPELIDSFVVEAPGNVEFEDTSYCIRDNGLGIEPGPYKFMFTYRDTGLKKIRIITYRKNKDVVRDSLAFRVNHIALQPDITGKNYGESIQLSIGSVNNKDVIYVWEFGGTIIRSASPDTMVQINRAVGENGIWYITDGKYESDRKNFRFVLRDTCPPVIRAENDNDTVFYDINGVSTFIITDIGAGVDKKRTGVIVDGNTFTIESVDDSLFRYLVDTDDSLLNGKQLTVFSYDLSVRNGLPNKTEKTFYLKYKNFSSNIFLLKIQWPNKQNIRVSNKNYTIIGELINYSRNSRVIPTLIYSINGVEFEDTTKLIGTYSRWYHPFLLRNTTNTIIVRVKDTDASDSCVIYYDSTRSDTSNRVILPLSPNPFRDDYIAARQLKLSFDIIDMGLGIKAAYCLVNGKKYDLQMDNVENYKYSGVIGLDHGRSGNSIRLVTVDNKNMVLDTNIAGKIIYQNNKPYLKSVNNIPKTLQIGKIYTDTIYYTDLDNDPVTAFLKIGTDSVPVINGIFKWNITGPVGERTLSLVLSDGFGDTLYTEKTIILEANQKISAIKINPQVITGLPKTIQAGDTIIDTLIADSAMNKVTFLIDKKYSSYSFVNLDSSTGVITFTPIQKDTGFIKLKLMVTDGVNSDTIYHNLNIINRNRPSTIFCTDLPELTADGRIDMILPAKSDTIRFKIEDPDSNNEIYDVTIVYLGQSKKFVVKSGSMTFEKVLFSNDQNFGIDSIVVTVLGSLSATPVSYKKIIAFGLPPLAPVNCRPSNLDVVRDTQIVLSWDEIAQNRYLLYGGYYGEPLELLISSARNTFTLPTKRSGIYVWQVKATNGKMEIDGPVMLVNYQYKNAIKISNKENLFKKVYILNKDLFDMPVSWINNSGNVKDTVTVKNPFVNQPKVINGRLTGTLTNADTGFHTVKLSVRDSFNTDSVEALVYIAPPLRRDCQIVCPAILNNSINTKNVTSAETSFTFKVLGSDHPIVETFVLRIKQNLIERSITLDTTRTFTLKLYPSLIRQQYNDTLIIYAKSVIDSSDTDTLKITIVDSSVAKGATVTSPPSTVNTMDVFIGSNQPGTYLRKEEPLFR
jgi:hypothetical protein